MSHLNWESTLAPLPFVAILRGLQFENVEKIVGQLCESGFRAVEIPFNSPDPLKSVELAAHKFGGDILIGGGTVLDAKNVERIHDVGGQFVVSPNTDHAVIKATKSLDMISIPGVSSPTEAFAALQAGADVLKLFPAENLPPIVVKAMRAVLPKESWLMPVGGINPRTFGRGSRQVAGFGFRGKGKNLFQAGWFDRPVSHHARVMWLACKQEERRNEFGSALAQPIGKMEVCRPDHLRPGKPCPALGTLPLPANGGRDGGILRSPS